MARSESPEEEATDRSAPRPLPRWRRLVRDVRQLVRALRRGDPDVSYDGLRESERLHRTLAESSRDVIWLLDFPDRLRYVSPASEQVLGWTPDDQMLQQWGDLRMFTEASAERVARVMEEAIAARKTSITYEAEHRRADGSTVWCEVHQALVYDDDGRPVSAIGVTRDISDRRELQEQLTTAQKSELIGTLAGGIAHDFNNFLTVVVGSLELLLEQLEKDEEAASLLRDGLLAAERASGLTAQLLAFSRRQPVELASVDVASLLRRTDPLLRRLAGERIGVTSSIAPDLAAVHADENEIQQMLLNLGINARDAIPGHGTISIRAWNAAIDAPAAAELGLAAGPYVTIAVSDDGVGMDDAVRRRATEPFFTTKEKGQGTGLGLSTTERMLDRIGGALSIETEKSVGTTVRIHLPALHGPSARSAPPASKDGSTTPRGTERVLVVEDQPGVRSVAGRILRSAGYAVHEAAGPQEALAWIAEGLASGVPERMPRLVLSDLVMPGMDGTELAARIRERIPSMRFVMMSGYLDRKERSGAVRELPGRLLAKPFHARALLRVVREVLDDPGERPPR